MIQSSFDPVPPRRVVWLSLLTAAVSMLGAITLLVNGTLSWSVMLTGMTIGLAGFQVANVRAIFSSLAPKEVRGWMRPVAFGLYALGIVLFLAGVRALVLLAAAG